MRNGQAAFTPVLQNDNDLSEFDIPGGRVRWAWREVPEEAIFQVRAEVIGGPSLFLITVSHTEEDQRPGIVELLGKITMQSQDVEKHTVQANQKGGTPS